MKIPLILLGTQDAVKNVLTGATNVSIPDVSNEYELDELLQLQGLIKLYILLTRIEIIIFNYRRYIGRKKRVEGSTDTILEVQ